MVNSCDHTAWKQEEEELDQLLEKYQGDSGNLIPALQEVQNYYGYLPERGMKKVAETFKIAESRVFGVATFYAQFHLQPRGKYIVRVCLGTACHVRGAEQILNKVSDELGITAGETTEDLMYTLEPVACIGSCGLAPAVMVNDNTYGRLTPDMIPEILNKYQ